VNKFNRVFHSFGISGNIRDSCSYIDEDTIVYALGPLIAFHNLKSQDIEYLPERGNVQEVLGIAVTDKVKSNFVAVVSKDHIFCKYPSVDLIIFKNSYTFRSFIRVKE
jgi:hypothetical protein